MSDLTSVLVWTERTNACSEFARLIERLRRDANFHKAELHESRVCHNVTSLDLSEALAATCDIAKQVIDSNRHLALSSAYQLIRQKRWIWMDFEFSGDRFNGGARVLEQGYIQLSLSHPDLTGEKAFLDDAFPENTASHSLLTSSESTQTTPSTALATSSRHDLVLSDAEDLFLRAFGRETNVADAAVQHCLMIVSNAAPFPVNSIMVAHVRAEEFGRDIARCYAMLEWGTPIGATLPPGVDILRLEDAFPRYREYAWKPTISDIRQGLSPEDQALLDFFAGVTRGDAERCLNLPASAINLLLDDFRPEGAINDHRYSDGALALTAHPRSNLGSFYRFMVETTRPGGRHAGLLRETAPSLEQ
jgi:hypothetical protein